LSHDKDEEIEFRARQRHGLGMSADRIRKGIAADPDAHATDENFWKSAKVVLPAR
jgi:hypothetical protein